MTSTRTRHAVWKPVAVACGALAVGLSVPIACTLMLPDDDQLLGGKKDSGSGGTSAGGKGGTGGTGGATGGQGGTGGQAGADAAPPPACDFYVSPDGTGDGKSQTSPFKLVDFWPHAGPGKTACLLDGMYTGDDSMITPPPDRAGAQGQPITIRALNDGGVLINGEAARSPIALRNNSWFVVEGVNACCSKLVAPDAGTDSSSVVVIDGSNNVIRRVCAWDAPDRKSYVFYVGPNSTPSQNNLLEDVAGWGTGLSIYRLYNVEHVTLRRAWGRWERSTVKASTMTFDLHGSYSTFVVCENCIGTWSGQSMPETYEVIDQYGNGTGTYRDGSVPYSPYGVFFAGGSSSSVDSKILGSLAYVQATDLFSATQVVFATAIDGLEVRDVVSVLAPAAKFSKVHPFWLFGPPDGGAVSDIAANLTGFGGEKNGFSSDFQQTNVVWAPTTDLVDVYGSDAGGATVCKRYVDGQLTMTPLWPWPMTARIKAAIVQSGRPEVDVDQTVATLFGPPPSECTSK